MTGFTPGTVSVVVFWATWCEASNASIPVLNSAQREYAARGVRVVAVSGRDSEGESLSRVRAVVGAARSKIEFGVAFDDRRRTAHAWMDAAEQEYIPTAFIVDGRGRVAWIGSPLWPPGEFREALASAVAGELDDARREKLQLRWANFVARVRGLEGQVQRARMSGQIDEASRIFDELISLNERSAPQYAMEKFTLLLTPTHEERAYEFAKSAIAGPLRDDPELLNEVAWAILDESGLQKRDLNLALKAARRADELTNGQNAAILDTTARAYQSLGDFNQAVAFQARAVELAPDESERADYAERLREYRQALERGGR